MFCYVSHFEEFFFPVQLLPLKCVARRCFHQKYLSVYITCTLSWQLQCYETKKKAMRVLRILQRISHRAIDRLRHVHTYPQCVQLLNAPPLIGLRIQISKGIDCIESVQRHAACFVNSDYSCHSCVSSMLTDLNWPSLQSRRRIYHLGMFYKIHRGHVNISLPYDLTSIPAYGCTRASQDFKIRLLSSSVDIYKRSFYERSIPAWNALSADVVSPAYYPEFIQIVAYVASVSNRVIARKLEQKQKKG